MAPYDQEGMTEDAVVRRGEGSHRRHAADDSDSVLQASDRRFRAFFEQSATGLFRITPEGRIIESNTAFQSLVGLTGDELRACDIESYTHPDDWPNELNLTRRLTADGQSFCRFEKRYIRPDGRTVWADVTISAVFDEEGTLDCFTGIAQEITDRKEITRALAESENRYRTLAAMAPDIIFIVDRDGLVQYVNTAVARLLRKPAESLLGRNVLELFPPETAERHAEDIHRVWSTGQPFESLDHLSIESRDIVLESKLVPLRDESGRPVAVLGVSRDISARIRDQKELLRFRMGIERSNDAIFVTETDGTIVFANPAFERIYGHDRAEVIGKTPRILKSGKEARDRYADFWRTLLSQQIVEGEILNRTKDGRVLTIEGTTSPIIDDNGCTVGFLAIHRDITERKKAQEEIASWKQRYEVVAAASGQVVYEYDIPSGSILWSGVIDRVLGYTNEEMSGGITQWMEMIHPDDREEAVRELDRAECALEPYETEYRFRRRDGSYVWIFDSGLFLPGADGRAERMVGMMADISARREAEERQLQREQRYRSLFDLSPAGILLEDANGIILEVNDALCHSFGYERDELIGAHVSLFVPESDRESVADAIRAILAGETIRHEKVNLRKDGSVCWMELRETRIILPDGAPGIMVVAHDVTDRKRAETAILQSEARYRTLFETANDAIFLLGEHGITDCNSKSEEIFGCSRADLLGQTIADFSPRTQPDGHASAALLEHFLSEAGGGGPQFFEWKLHRCNGATFDAEITLNAIDLHGLRMTQAVVRDISERKAAEEALRESAQYLSTIFRATPTIVAITTMAEGRFVAVNEAFEHIQGHTRQEAIGRTSTELGIFAVPSDRDRLIAAVRQNGAVYNLEMVFRTKRGDNIVGLVSSVPIVYSRQECLLTVITDITERKRMEQALRESEERFRRLSEASFEGIGISDGGVIVDANNALAAMFGYTPAELIGRPVSDLVAPGDVALVHKHVLSGSEDTYQHMAQRRDGSVFSVEAHAKAIPYDGRIVRVTAIRDITDRKRADEALIAAKENAERSDKLKDAFIANISHEIRTPLNIIIGYSDIIAELYKHLVQPDELEYFRSIERAGRRLMRTVEHILNISSIQAGTYRVRIETADAVEIVSNFTADMQSLAASKGLTLSFESECEHALVDIDRYSLEQALSNLLDNAIKFTSRGGVTIRVSTSEQAVRIDVADTGVGISNEYLPQVFEKFSQEGTGFTRPFEGLGLGMALTKHYVEVNNGTIRVASSKGNGTTFTMEFSPSQLSGGGSGGAVPAAENRPTADRADPLQQKTVLVVEDDPQSQQYMQILLSRTYRVLLASNAQSAWDMLHTETIHSVLMDISLQGEVDGLQLTRTIRAQEDLASVPIIALTAHAFPADRQKSLDAGCTDYLSKPFQREQLLALLEQYTR